MNQVFLSLAFQSSAPDDNSMWIILAVVVVILFFIVVIVAIGLTIFFIMRKRSKALNAPQPEMSLSAGPAPSSDYAGMPPPEAPPIEAQPEPVPSTFDPPAPIAEDSREAPLPADTPFDPSRTVAIIRENTVPISYGTIRFISGVLADQQFEVDPEGTFIGREGTLSQIVVSDPRISKRHLWIGVRDGVVKIVDQDSRNGTFINDPKSERITEASLNP